MKKHIFGRKLKRDTNERKALIKGLVSSLVMHERITTTEEKAKTVKPHIEKLVTKANREDLRHAYTLLQPYLNAKALKKMITDVAPRFKNRPGGYTRIIKVGNRFSDNANLVFLEWVVKKPLQAVVPQEKTTKKLETTKLQALPATITQKAAGKTSSDRKKPTVRKTTTKKTTKEKSK